MANITRNIGLSLGADSCWSASYQEILRKLDLAIPMGADTIRFAVEHVTVEPYDLRQPCHYDLVIDRLTHWFHTSREWIKKAVIMDELYVLNNPWAVQSMEKQTTYAAMMRLGMRVPETWMVPPKVGPDNADTETMLQRHARHFDLGEVGRKVGYPFYMKPYDGGGWRAVTRIENERSLRAAYEQSGNAVMHLQQSIEGYDLFVRCIGVGPQVLIVRYDPSKPLHGRYTVDFHFVDAEEWERLTEITLTINGFFNWEFNSCEALRHDGIFHPIDFANPCPDFQVTSLHYHFPAMVKAMLRWSLFCAATKRPMRPNLDWDPYFDIAKRDLPFRDKLRAYAAVSRERFEAERFEEFCDQHLGDLDAVTWEFFGTDRARTIVREKVAALYPRHEVEAFTAHFWGLIQFWRKTESDRLGYTKPAEEPVVPVADNAPAPSDAASVADAGSEADQ